MDRDMNGLWVWEGWIKRWKDYESKRRMDQDMNGEWVYEKDGSRDEWNMSLWEG